GEPRCHRADVVIGDGAHRAQRLGDDQVGRELGQRGLVELVERLASLRDRADAGVDLLRLEPRWDHAPREAWEPHRLGRVVAFVDKLVEPAEAMGHHPDLSISWNKVTVSITTHAAGGLTENDFALAKRIDQVAGR